MTGLERLLHAVIKKAAKDKDLVYFYGDAFSTHCRLLGASTERVRKVAVRHILKH